LRFFQQIFFYIFQKFPKVSFRYFDFAARDNHREFCTTPLFVMPAKAGIQEAIDNTGFPPSRE